MAEVITVDGNRSTLNDTKLATLQGAVGGYIEIVSIGNNKIMVLDEEGKLKNKPINRIATELYGNPNDVVVGDVVVCDDNEID